MKEDKTQAGQTVPLNSLVGNQYEQMSWEERYRHHEALAIECIETAKAKVEEGNFGIAQCYLDCVPKHIDAMTGCIQVSNDLNEPRAVARRAPCPCSPCPVPTDPEQRLDVTCAHCGSEIDFRRGEVYTNGSSYVCKFHAANAELSGKESRRKAG